MHILFLSYAESHSNKWVNALCEKGHDVYFVMQRHQINRLEALNKEIKIIELPFTGKKGYILNSLALRKIAKIINPDVVNVHYASGYGTMARLAKLKNVLLSVWGSDVYDFPYKNRICMNIIRKNLLNAEQLASTSNCMATQVRKLIGNQKEITITPFGIDIEAFSPQRYEKETKDTIVIGNIKVISPKYGIDDLVCAFALLREELMANPETKLIASKLRCVIYGRGEQTEEIIELIREKNLQDCVTLPGEISHDQVPKALSNIDIFCATSILDSESFGVSVVEAEAMGVPIVATDVDGFKEVVEDGVTGIIVRRKNISEISAALKRLVLDENLRYSMGQCGRNRVVERYNFNDNVSTMEKLYLNIARGRS